MAKGKKFKAPKQKKAKEPIPKVAKVVHKSPSKVATVEAPEAVFIFGRINYIFMLAGAACLALGLALMSGGEMPDPDTWDPGIIYSFRRITLAPMVMIVGLILLVFAIFKRK